MSEVDANKLVEAMQASLAVVAPPTAPAVGRSVQAHPAFLPRTLSRSYTIDSIPTHFWIQLFHDRVVFGISQLAGGKIGTFLLCQAHQNEISTRKVDYEITPLLGAGRDDPLLDVYGRLLVEKISSHATLSRQTVVLGISLLHQKGNENKEGNKHDPKMMKCIIDLAMQLYQDALHLSL